MRYHQITEAISANNILFHFTGFRTFLSIILENKLKTNLLFTEIEALSFTRAESPWVKLPYGKTKARVCMVFDKRKLPKTSPYYGDIGMAHKTRIAYDPHKREMEERLFKDITVLDKLTAVYVAKSNWIDVSDDLMKRFETVTAVCKRHNIPVVFVPNFEPGWLYKSKLKPVTEAVDPFYYHATFSNNLSSIMKEGLTPNTDRESNFGDDYPVDGRLFISVDFGGAVWYAHSLMDNFEEETVVLRFPKQGIEIEPDELGNPGDYYTAQSVPPNVIEFTHIGSGDINWKPLQQSLHEAKSAPLYHATGFYAAYEILSSGYIDANEIVIDRGEDFNITLLFFFRC